MEKTLFNNLMQSLKEAKTISKGKAKPSRRFAVEALDVKIARECENPAKLGTAPPQSNRPRRRAA